jgi:amino acid transporter
MAVSPGRSNKTSPNNGQSSIGLWDRIRRIIFGKPRDLEDKSLFRRLSLIPILAWIGLGADGLSSSSYGPEEAFRTLGDHTYLAIALALMTTVTVLIISAAYSRIIEEFPQGGGGYVVATKLLGKRAGVIAGSALLVDYVLTITVSIAAAGDAIFSFLPPSWLQWKLLFEIALIAGLTMINIRGVKESVLTLTPVFIVFIITHIILIVGGMVAQYPELPATARSIETGFQSGLATLGMGGMVFLFAHAYSLGGGTYTGLEAVSNGLVMMREPRVQTGKRTMMYMAGSLAFTASGLLLCYLLWNVTFVEGKTINAILVERVTSGLPFGAVFVILTLLSEGALLIVGAQTGFLGGPSILANMAQNSWVPHRFAALSERLTTQNGILLMGGASLVALLLTNGDVRRLVVVYSINVFLTFSLSMFGMAKLSIKNRATKEKWKSRAALFTVGFLFCGTILIVTILEKFSSGGWVTLLVTGTLIVLCFLIRRHYRQVEKALTTLYAGLGGLPRGSPVALGPPDPNKPTAAVLVSLYGGLGIHTVLNIFRAFPGHFKNLIFISVGVVDSGGFKGEGSVDDQRTQTERNLQQYVELAWSLKVPATYRFAVGTDAVEECEKLCLEVAKDFPQVTFFAGNVIFGREHWYQRFLHNETAFAVQKRLQWAGMTMVILPARV